MSEFKLSDGLDKSKIFLILNKNKNDRLDPHYYLPKFDILKLKLLNSGFELKYLNEICDINRGGSPRPIQNYLTHNEDGVNWIKIGDTKKVDKYIYTTKQKIKPIGVRYSRMVYEGDFILSNSMSFGKPYIMKTTGCIHDGWLLLRKKDNTITDDYLYTLLSSNIMYQLFKQATIGGVVDNLSIDLVKKIKIPIPNKIIQKNIVNILDNGIKQKQQKEKQAKDLLDSIDDYLLDELGITLPEIDNSLEKRIFEVNLSEISGIRFDPDYKSKIDNLNNLTWKYNLYELKDLMIGSAQYGANETAQECTSQDNVRYIRITDIDEIGILKENNMKTANIIQEQYILNYNDILFARSGSVGRCYIHKNMNNKAIFAGYLIRFILDEKKVNLDYFFYYCHSSIYKYWVSAIERPAVQSNINSEEYKSLKVPIPPIAKQNEIAEHIQTIRDNAKKLKVEAVQDLENAKIEVEKMILGK